MCVCVRVFFGGGLCRDLFSGGGFFWWGLGVGDCFFVSSPGKKYEDMFGSNCSSLFFGGERGVLVGLGNSLGFFLDMVFEKVKVQELREGVSCSFRHGGGRFPVGGPTSLNQKPRHGRGKRAGRRHERPPCLVKAAQKARGNEFKDAATSHQAGLDSGVGC